MHCAGKCYLARQLKEQQKDEQQIPNAKKQKFDAPPFFLPKPIFFSNIQYSSAQLIYHPLRVVLCNYQWQKWFPG